MIRIVLLLASLASAQNLCVLVGMEIYAQDKELTFLGVITDNPFHEESIMNEFGDYGSKFSATSILNEFGTFGSEFSAYSPFNEFTTTPPVIVDGDEAIAYLSKNQFLDDVTVDPDALLVTLSRGCTGSAVRAKAKLAPPFAVRRVDALGRSIAPAGAGRPAALRKAYPSAR